MPKYQHSLCHSQVSNLPKELVAEHVQDRHEAECHEKCDPNGGADHGMHTERLPESHKARMHRLALQLQIKQLLQGNMQDIGGNGVGAKHHANICARASAFDVCVP